METNFHRASPRTVHSAKFPFLDLDNVLGGRANTLSMSYVQINLLSDVADATTDRNLKITSSDSTMIPVSPKQIPIGSLSE